MEKRKVSFMDILAMIVVTLSFVYFFVVYYSKNVAADSNFTVQIVTAIISMDILILNYYFGSSKSSTAKDATIQAMQTASTTPTTVKAETVNAENVETINTNTTNLQS